MVQTWNYERNSSKSGLARQWFAETRMGTAAGGEVKPGITASQPAGGARSS
jgi:hypothetical protein